MRVSFSDRTAHLLLQLNFRRAGFKRHRSMGLRLLLCPVYPLQTASAGESRIMRNVMLQMASVRQSCYSSSAQHPSYGLQADVRHCGDHDPDHG